MSPAEFDALFADESEALGHRVPAPTCWGCSPATSDPRWSTRSIGCKPAGYRTACLTNNVVGRAQRPASGPSRDRAIMATLRRHRRVRARSACRKPEPRFYEIACELLGVEPNECVFLDDLGINLKPAAAMGMTTIKVASAEQASPTSAPPSAGPDCPWRSA